MLFKSPDALREDRRQAFADFCADWDKICGQHDVLKATGGYDSPLVIVSSIAITLAKAEAQEMGVGGNLYLMTLTKIRDALQTYNSTVAELNRIEKRSARFNAMAVRPR